MTYIGIDIGKSKHCIAAIDERANILLKPTFVPQQAEGFEQIAGQLRQLGSPDEVKIGMDLTTVVNELPDGRFNYVFK